MELEEDFIGGSGFDSVFSFVHELPISKISTTKSKKEKIVPVTG
jgi:hypothetical protein